MVYEWNAAKAKANTQKHAVSFDEAATVFLDPLALTFPDPDHSGGEEREITIGYTNGHRVVFVSHCQRGDRIRIISVRKATRTERRQYEEGIAKKIG
ncbi:MAG: BrnT family toxin [Acidobacteriota bacterium]